MFAVIKTGGKQYRVSEKDKIKIEKLASKEKSKIIFDKTLLIFDDKKIKIGNPFIKGAFVEAKIIGHGRGKKIKVFKFKPKKRYKKTMGHRQDYSEIEITKIKP